MDCDCGGLGALLAALKSLYRHEGYEQGTRESYKRCLRRAKTDHDYNDLLCRPGVLGPLGRGYAIRDGASPTVA